MFFTSRMEHVYIVVENGEAYPAAYKMYKQAVSAAKLKNAELLNENRADADLHGYEPIDEMDVEESATGTTQLYIEKGINILIHKLPVVGQNGGRRRRNTARK